MRNIKKTKEILKVRLSKNAIVCVDVGAKGGVFQLNNLSKYCNYYGFEPNPSEYTRLKQTDSELYLPYGLSEMGGIKQFYITKYASYSSLLKCNFENFEKNFGNVKHYSKWIKAFQIEKTIKIDTKTLDEFILEENIKVIDFLKLDTQGTELSLLKGAKQALLQKQISVIFAEVAFVEIYKKQNLYSDLDHYLKGQDYEFVDCRFYPEYVTNDLFLKSKYEKSRFSVGGDAIYVPKLENISNNKSQCLKVGIILSSLRYLSMSSVYLHHSGLTNTEIDNIHNFTNKRSGKDLFRSLLPPIILNLAKKIKNQ